MSQVLIDNYAFLARYKRWFDERLYKPCDALTNEERQRDRGTFLPRSTSR